MDLSVRSETFGQDDQRWIGASHGIDMAKSITLDTSTFVPATHYPDGYILSGTPLGEITATGLYGPYDDGAVDGREVFQGFLLTPTKPGSPDTTDVGGALFTHGLVVEANLPIAIDDLAKVEVAGRIVFE